MKITQVGQRFIHNGGAEIFLRELSKQFVHDITFRQSICTHKHLYEKEFCDTFPHPVIIGGKDEIETAIREGDVIICWGNVNLNSMDLTKPKVCIYNACAETRNQIQTSLNYITHAIACSTKTAHAVCHDVPHTIILPGISTERLTITESRSEKRQKLGIKDTDFLVGMISRIEAQKRQSWLVEAMRRADNNTKAIFVGDGPMLQELKENSPSNCLFVGHKNDVGNWWNILDCYCLLSTNEGCPAALFEAMYCKVPIISTLVGSAADLLNNENSIIISESEDLQAAIKTIRQRDRTQMVNLAYTKFQKHGEIKKTAYRWMNLIRKLSGEKCENMLL